MNDLNHFWTDTMFGVQHWKWISLATMCAVSIFLLPLFKISFSRIKKWQNLRQVHQLIEFLLHEDIHIPLAWLLLVTIWRTATGALELPPKFEKILFSLVQMTEYFFLIRFTYLAVEAFGKWIDLIVKNTQNTLDDQLVPLATKTLKVLVVVFGALMILQSLGFNVMSLLAGLGLGGLALALAAQDTAANVFGSITIILDRPFQVGDWVKIGETEGCVEEIGFRSTRIRTFYLSVVSIPNSVMAKERIDNLGVRPSRRFSHTIGITYETPSLRIQQFMEHIRYQLMQHPEILKEDIKVHLNKLADSSLNILIQFFMKVENGDEELILQELVLLEIKDIAEKLNVNFAYPTHTIYIPKAGEPS